MKPAEKRGTRNGEFKKLIRFMAAASASGNRKTRLLVRPKGWFSNIGLDLEVDWEGKHRIRLSGPGFVGAYISAGGTLSPFDRSDAVVEVLREVVADPERYASSFGHFTGQCTFCGRKLTDARSYSVGYGRDCAERFGLRWGQIGQADLERNRM
ncbi:DUF6011 domain-containing protein [Steroidobacter sp.]|uniref:DUF6011 domain-containing protein n=1 Tax=Steroidobacter sp. TaxID=1978227 RepID=UPI0039C939B7